MTKASNKVIFAILALFVILSIINIDKPGVNSDQLLFVNAAIGPLDNTWIYKSIHGFPVLIMIYLGALKSYIFKPIFYFFGVSIYSIRIPMIFLMAGAVYILYRAISIKTNFKIALLISLLLATDTSFIAFSRIDYGPVVLEFFLKALSFLFLFLFIKTRQQKYLLLLIASLGLGLFNKINFIWFINSLVLGVIIFYRKLFFRNKKELIKLSNLLLLVSYVCFIGYSLWILKKSTVEYNIQAAPLSAEILKNNIITVVTNYLNLINGSTFLQLVYGVPTHILNSFFGWGMIILNLTGFAYLIRNKYFIKEKVFRFYLFILVIFISLLAQLFMTSNAISPWHTYSLFPFLTILTAIFLYQLQIRYKFIKLFLTLLILCNIIVYMNQIFYYDKPVTNLNWSNRSIDLIKFTDSYPGLVLYLGGIIQTDILTFSKNYNKYTPIEMMVNISSYGSYALALQDYFKKESTILVIVPNDEFTEYKAYTLFKDVQPNFFRFIKEFNIKLTKLNEFKDGNKITYTVYSAD